MLVKKKETCEVPLTRLRLDDSVQMRETISQVAVQEYADAMAAGDEFPAIIVFGRTGGPYYVADGFHRYLAKKKLKHKTILCEVNDGGKRDAMLHAMNANARHGVRRTNADKQRAVQACLNDREWVQWADSEIARRCAVSKSIVVRLRELMGNRGIREIRTYIDTSGNLRTRKVPYRNKKLEPTVAEQDREVFGICPYCHRPMLENTN